MEDTVVIADLGKAVVHHRGPSTLTRGKNLRFTQSQPIPHIYSSAQANTAHVFRCGIGQIKYAELIKRVTQKMT